MPCSAAVAIARRSGGWPTCQSPVPAESSSTRPATLDAAMRARSSALGHRRAADVAQADHQQAHGSGALGQARLGARQVLGRVDAGRERLGRQRDRDAEAGFEHAQLFQRFDAFQPSRRQRGEPLQEAGAVARRCRCGAASGRRRACASRSRAKASRGHGIGARLKYSASPLAARTSLTALGSSRVSTSSIGAASVAISAPLRAQRRRATARMPAAGANGSSPCRFTTMVSSRPAGDARAFGEAIGAGRVVGRGHRDAHAAVAQRVGDALVVGGDPDLARAGRERAARDMQHQRLAAEQAQRLARQARGGVARGNGDDEIGAWSCDAGRAPACCGGRLVEQARSRTLPAIRRAPAR